MKVCPVKRPDWAPLGCPSLSATLCFETRSLLAGVLVRVSVTAMKHHDQKESWGGKGLFDLYFHIIVHH